MKAETLLYFFYKSADANVVYKLIFLHGHKEKKTETSIWCCQHDIDSL